jgi:ATP-binding cassette subfamily B protein/subfamily B ATP-binding cassette protein MsbA
MLLWLAAGAIAALAGVVALAEQSTGLNHDIGVLGEAALAVAISTAGVWIVVREARSPVGWIICGLGVALATSAFSGEYVTHELAGGAAPGAFVQGVALAGYVSFPAMVLAAPFLLLLGPGSRRGAGARLLVVLPLAVAGAASLAWLLLLPGPLKGFSAVQNPLGVAALDGMRGLAVWAWLPIALLTIGQAVVPVPRRRVAKAPEVAEVEEEAVGLPTKDAPTLRERPKRAWSFLKDFPRVFPYLRPHWKLGATSVSLLGFGVLAGLLSPWPLAILVDTVLGNKPLPSVLGFIDGWSRTSLLVFAVVAGVIVTALEHGVGMGQTYVDTALEERMSLEVRSDLFRHMQRLSQAFHDKSKKGMMIFTVTKATSVGTVTVSIGPIVQNLATLVGMFLIAYTIDSELALLSLAVVPFIYYSTGYYTKRIEPRLYYVQGLEGQAMSIAYEAMSMLRVIVAFGREKHEYSRFRRQGEQAVNARIDLTVRQTFFNLAVSVLTAGGTALVLGFGGWHVLQHQLTVGELLVVMSYIAAVYQPLQAITSTLASLQQEFISMQMVLGVLGTPADITEDPDAITIEQAKGNLALENVSFAYDGREGTLQNISFEVSAGQRVGIVGPTGAGKSTLVSLFPRFCDPDEGRILLEGISTRKLTLESLRRQFSVVHQEPMLFSGTIADNIRYGRLEATDGEVEAAAAAANAHDFISELPKSYKTALGEGGPQLSGGERQRIAVARAFLKDAPILILDEPTSSIDSGTESVILDALDRLMVGRTTITIAHRLGTIRGADLVLVMDGGKIVERGTHAELLALDGLYRRLYEAQVADDYRHTEASDALHERMVTAVKSALDAPALTLRERAERAGQILRDAQSERGDEILRDASRVQEGP